MYCASSKSFFEISDYIEYSNTLRGRLHCFKDFFKRLLVFPFGLIVKSWKTVFRVFGIIFSLVFVLITLGSYFRLREVFVNRLSNFAKDLADWLLLPIAIIVCFCRFILAIFIHPKLYFNGLT